MFLTPVNMTSDFATEPHKAPLGYKYLLTALLGAGIEVPEMKKRGRPRKS